MRNFFRATYVVIFLSLFFGWAQPVFAQYYESRCCSSPLPNPQCITVIGSAPAGCEGKIYYCRENTYCGTGGALPGGLAPASGTPCETGNNVGCVAENTFDVNIFDLRIRFDSDKAIAQIMFIGFTAFMGIALLITVIKGIQASYIRATADSDGDVANANKSLQNSLIGFALIILSLVISQLVASVIGIGSLIQLTNVMRILPS